MLKLFARRIREGINLVELLEKGKLWCNTRAHSDQTSAAQTSPGNHAGVYLEHGIVSKHKYTVRVYMAIVA